MSSPWINNGYKIHIYYITKNVKKMLIVKKT